jgi:hypothetical protein
MSTNKHPLEQDELMAYLDGELPTDRAAAAVAYLERCPECQAFAGEMRDLSRRLMAWEVEAPEARIPEKIIAALDEREHKPEASRITSPSPFRSRVMARRWAWVGAFAILCVVVGLSVPTLHRQMGKFATVAKPERASDSNGLFHGLDERAQKPVFDDGKDITDQQDKSGMGTAGKLAVPLNGRNFTQLTQLAPGATSEAPGPAGPMIVRTAGITLTTKDFDIARSGLDEILKRHHGYVGELNVSTPTGSGRSFTATLRVPADQLDAAMADLRKLGRVESESQSGQEITAQYVDLEARLTNARHTEARLTDLLNQRTGKLSDVLAFEKEIDRVRGEIESMEAERKNLANQVDFATINVTAAEDYRAELQLAPLSTSSRMRNAAVEGYRAMIEGVVGVMLFIFSYGPSLLLWGGVLFFPARAVWRKIRPRFAR